jgi:hypothetical protein
MPAEELCYFRRLVFISVLSMQFHPRNDPADQVDELIDFALSVSERSAIAYQRHFDPDNIPF